MATSINNAYTTGYVTGLVASQYPEEVRTKFRENLDKDQRLGQAFMNALPISDYQRLTGTDADPFYSEDPNAIAIALDYLQDL